LTTTQRGQNFEGGVIFGVVKNVCSGLALILIIMLLLTYGEKVLGIRKAEGNVRAGEMFDGGKRLRLTGSGGEMYGFLQDKAPR